MKNLKFGFIALCGMLLTFSACKKDKDNTPTPNNSFVIGNSNYTANVGFYTIYGTDETDLLCLNKSLYSTDSTGLNIALIAFGGGSIPAAGTYTYTNGTPDLTKNFTQAFVSYNATYSSTEGQVVGGVSYNSGNLDATGSTVTLSKSGSTYTIVYDFKFTDTNKTVTTINGQYTGTLTKTN